MKKIYVYCVGLMIVALIGGTVFWNSWRVSRPIACTTEAKICPDGTAVGRTGPQCQFAECPVVKTVATTTMGKGYLTGTVSISPTCPVERMPPDPTCAPKPYAAFVTISGAHNFYIALHADSAGIFRTPLPVGIYTILIHQTTLYPRCDTDTVTITEDATTTSAILCDSGIR